MTYAIARLKKRQLTDPDCSRSTGRLFAAAAILDAAGVKHEWPEKPEHERDCPKRPGSGYFGQAYCTPRCPVRAWVEAGPVWEDWVTDAMFAAAYDLADTVITERGNAYQAQAWRLKQERAKA